MIDTKISCFLDRLISDEKAIYDLKNTLFRESSEEVISLENEKIAIDHNVQLTVISKIAIMQLLVEYSEVSVVIGIGEIDISKSGLIIPRYCFAKTHYNQDLDPVSTDFYT